MALVVETGEGLTTAESYLSVADFRSRATALGLTYLGDGTTWIDSASAADVEAALRRATAHLDAQYLDSWLGQKRTWQQALQWPRDYVLARGGGGAGLSGPLMYSAGSARRRSYGYGGVRAALGGVYTGAAGAGQYLPSGTLPRALLDALAHVAGRELAQPGYAAPDGSVSEYASETVGPVSVTYSTAAGAGGPPRLVAVDALVAPLLGGAGSVQFVGRS